MTRKLNINQPLPQLLMNQLMVKEIKNKNIKYINLPEHTPLLARLVTDGQLQEVYIYQKTFPLQEAIFKLPTLLGQWCRRMMGENETELELFYCEPISALPGYHIVMADKIVSIADMLPHPFELPADACPLLKKYYTDRQKSLSLCQEIAHFRMHFNDWHLAFGEKHIQEVFNKTKAERLAYKLDAFNKAFQLAPLQENLIELLLVCCIGNDFLNLVKNNAIKAYVQKTMSALNTKLFELLFDGNWLELLNHSRSIMHQKCSMDCCKRLMNQNLLTKYAWNGTDSSTLDNYTYEIQNYISELCGLEIDKDTTDKVLVQLLAKSRLTYLQYFYFIALEYQLHYLVLMKHKLEHPELALAKNVNFAHFEKIMIDLCNLNISFNTVSHDRLALVLLYLNALSANLNEKTFMEWCNHVKLPDLQKPNPLCFQEKTLSDAYNKYKLVFVDYLIELLNNSNSTEARILNCINNTLANIYVDAGNKPPRRRGWLQ